MRRASALRAISLSASRRGSILILVLWMMIVLSIVGLSYSSAVRNQVVIADQNRARIEAYWAAWAGVEFSKVILTQYEDLTMLTALDPLFDDPEIFLNQPVGLTTSFSILGLESSIDRTQRYGLIDESSFLNVNRLNDQVLFNFPAVTEEMVDGLLDWRDPDMEPRPLGAESEYYYDLDDPYPVKNGPLSSVEELKRIKGWEIIFDSARPDPYLRFTAEELRVPLLADPYEAQLLLDSLTAWSTTAETAPDGQPKIDLASADAQSITERGISGIAQNQANAIAAFNAYTSVTDLIDVLGNYELATQVVDYFTYNPDAGSTVDQAIAAIDQTAAQINLGGGLVINQAAGQEDQTGVAPGSVNLNTAPYETLMALPGMTEDLAWTIIDAREEEPFQIGSQIAQLPNMTEESFRGIYPFVGATTSLFRVVSEGIESSTGVKVTITAALRVVNGEVLVAHWKVD